jgi:hypothetical protein
VDNNKNDSQSLFENSDNITNTAADDEIIDDNCFDEKYNNNYADCSTNVVRTPFANCVRTIL